MSRKKITVVGAGQVGRTTAQMLAYRELGDIVLVNRTVDKAKGVALDLMQSAPIDGFDVNIVGAGSYDETEDSDLIIISAGVQRRGGMSRKELLCINSQIVSTAVSQTTTYSPDAPIIVITNPVDAMTFLALKVSRKPRTEVIGMAGILDSARFRSFIAMETGVSVKDISTLVLGCHGDFMVPLPAHSSINGVPITRLLSAERIEEIIQHTRIAGTEIIELKKDSSACYAPAAAIAQMAEAILKDKKRILPCAVYLDGEYSLTDVVMGVPVKLGGGGVEAIIEVDLDEDERRRLVISAEKVRILMTDLRIEVCSVVRENVLRHSSGTHTPELLGGVPHR